MKNSFNVIGLMSGTSLDGLDIALCEFRKEHKNWTFKILATECYNYESLWQSRLKNAMALSKEELFLLHNAIGEDYAQKINEFLLHHKAEGTVDLICSHGQTIHHDPERGSSLQIGNPAIIASKVKIKTVADLRIQDVALGGQGAPIVPMGEWHLFPECSQFLNLGGIANITKMNRTESTVLAYDISPANGMLNHLVSERELKYDKDGALAATGSIHQDLLKQLNGIPYYSARSPKTLDAGFFQAELLPLFDAFSISFEDKLRTAVEHIAYQISQNANDEALMITGGGTLNTFLIERINAHCKFEIIIPSNEIIEYKEAIIMAFLGLLRNLNQPNIFASVTGASKDHSSGLIYDV